MLRIIYFVFIGYLISSNVEAQDSLEINRFSSQVDSFYNEEAYEALQEYFVGHLDLVDSVQQPRLFFRMTFEYAYLQALLESYESSMQLFSRSLNALYRQEKLDSSNIVDNYYYLAYVSDQLDDTERSLVYLRASLDFLDFPDYLDQKVNVLNGIANIYLKKSDYDNALFYQDQALQTLKSLPEDRAALARVYDDQSLIYYYKNDYNAAKSRSEKALAIIMSTDTIQAYQKISSFNNAALIAIKLGHFQEARQFLELALQDIEVSGDQRLYALSLFNVAFHSFKTGDFLKAKDFFKKSIDAFQNKSNPNRLYMGKAYYYLGQISKDLKRYEEANQYFASALRQLIPTFDSPKNLAIPSSTAVSFSNRDLIRCVQSLAESTYLQAVQSDVTIQHSNTVLAMLDLALTKIKEQRRNYASEASRLFLAETSQEVFDVALNICYGLYKESGDAQYIKRAFQYIESSNAPLLLRNVTSQRSEWGGVPEYVLQKQRSLFIDLNFYQKTLASIDSSNQILQDLYTNYLFDAKESLDSIQDVLQQEYGQYYTDVYGQNTIDLEDFQKSLSKEDVVLQYYCSEEVIYRLTISEDQLFFEKLDSIEALQQQIGRLNTLVSQRPAFHGDSKLLFKQYAQLSDSISKLLIPKLKVATPLIIIPSGFLNTLCFEALLSTNSNTDVQGFLEARFLTEDHAICYQPSATLYNRFQSMQGQKHTRVMGLAPFVRANVHSKLSVLDYTQDEIESIASIFETKSYMHDAANKGTFLDDHQDFSILHIASHAESNVEQPAYSRLWFHPDNRHGDQALYSYEIQNMKFESELVVLSACESGVGQINQGEGALSLAKSFMYGGVPSVLMTRWKIDDGSTHHIVAEYYRQLKEGQTKQKALQLAKIQYLDQHADVIKAHPFYWAGLSQIGNTAAFTSSNPLKPWLIPTAILFAVSLIVFFFFKTGKRNLD